MHQNSRKKLLWIEILVQLAIVILTLASGIILYLFTVQPCENIGNIPCSGGLIFLVAPFLYLLGFIFTTAYLFCIATTNLILLFYRSKWNVVRLVIFVFEFLTLFVFIYSKVFNSQYLLAFDYFSGTIRIAYDEIFNIPNLLIFFLGYFIYACIDLFYLSNKSIDD